MVNADLLYTTIFKRDLNAEDTESYLKKVTEEYPYFAPAFFYLLQQSHKGSVDYMLLAAKTSLLFPNINWLNYLQKTTAPEITETSVQSPGAQALADAFSTLMAFSGVNPKQKEKISNGNPAKEAIDTDESAATNIAPPPSPVLPNLSTVVTEDTFTYEPLHTTDYFASQGIKLAEEVKPGDTLGKQLKSFTEWLKTMKKINPELKGSVQSDTAIQLLAERSNDEKEVITETMAEVLTQQGKTAKAVEMYQKLSLQNPSKSAYFAAKIEKLNGN